MANNMIEEMAQINMRFSGRDLFAIQQRTLEEGIPYQTLAASVLHAQNFWQIVRCDEVVKSPSMAFLLSGKRKLRFSLSLQINNLRCKQLICAPVHGRYDDFLRSHHDVTDNNSDRWGPRSVWPSFAL